MGRGTYQPVSRIRRRYDTTACGGTIYVQRPKPPGRREECDLRGIRGGGVPVADDADVRAVLQPGESGVPWSVLAERLAELAPEYAGITADMLRESLARFGVPSQDVKVGRNNLKGARRTALDDADQRRQIGPE